MRHALTGSSSIKIVQVPQTPSPQPYLTSGVPMSSCSASSSVRSLRTHSSCFTPLTVRKIWVFIGRSPESSFNTGCIEQRALYQSPGQYAPVVDRSVNVRLGFNRVSCALGNGFDARVTGTRRTQRVQRRVFELEGPVRYSGDDDPNIFGDHAIGARCCRRRHRDGREIGVPAGDFFEPPAAGVRSERNPDFCDDLSGLRRCRQIRDEKFGRGNTASAARALNDNPSSRCNQDAWNLAGWVSMGNAAADGATSADTHVTDQCDGMRQHGTVLLHQLRFDYLAVPRHGRQYQFGAVYPRFL